MAWDDLPLRCRADLLTTPHHSLGLLQCSNGPDRCCGLQRTPQSLPPHQLMHTIDTTLLAHLQAILNHAAAVDKVRVAGHCSTGAHTVAC